MAYLTPILLLAFSIIAVSLIWRVLSRRRSLPCPSWLSWMIDNPLSKAHTHATLARLELSPGLHVLDDILRRMQAHQAKKRAMLRELRLAHALPAEPGAASGPGRHPDSP